MGGCGHVWALSSRQTNVERGLVSEFVLHPARAVLCPSPSHTISQLHCPPVSLSPSQGKLGWDSDLLENCFSFYFFLPHPVRSGHWTDSSRLSSALQCWRALTMQIAQPFLRLLLLCEVTGCWEGCSKAGSRSASLKWMGLVQQGWVQGTVCAWREAGILCSLLLDFHPRILQSTLCWLLYNFIFLHWCVFSRDSPCSTNP